MAGMYSFRAFARSKPSWMLTYSWEKESQIVPGEAMQNLAMAQLMAGTNTWDAQRHVMSGSNDIQTRKLIFGWIKEHEQTFFHPRQPIRPVGVYFSPATRDYFAKEFIDSYRGILMLLMQSHLEFQIVTPKTLADFHGDMLILPDVRCLSPEEGSSLETYVREGKTLMATGETGKYDGTGAEQTSNPLSHLAGKNFVNRPNCPGKAYYAQLQREFNQDAAAGTFESQEFNKLRQAFAADILKVSKAAVEVAASPFVSAQVATVDGKPSVFLANFKGLKSKEVARQIPEQGVKVTFSAKGPGTVVFLPFLGQPQKIQAEFSHGKLSCELPSIERGAVVWLE